MSEQEVEEDFEADPNVEYLQQLVRKSI